METVSLLFDANDRLLGEVSTDVGALRRFVLTQEGESRLGDDVAAWQTQGVPLGRARVLVRDAGFLPAVESWSRYMGFELLTLPSDALDAWQIMTILPFLERERHSLLAALITRDVKERKRWRACLKDASEAVRDERAKTIVKLKKG